MSNCYWNKFLIHLLYFFLYLIKRTNSFIDMCSHKLVLFSLWCLGWNSEICVLKKSEIPVDDCLKCKQNVHNPSAIGSIEMGIFFYCSLWWLHDIFLVQIRFERCHIKICLFSGLLFYLQKYSACSFQLFTNIICNKYLQDIFRIHFEIFAIKGHHIQRSLKIA